MTPGNVVDEIIDRSLPGDLQVEAACVWIHLIERIRNATDLTAQLTDIEIAQAEIVIGNLWQALQRAKGQKAPSFGPTGGES